MNTTVMASDYLATFLAPLSPYLARPDTTDVYINTPQEIWVERAGGATAHHDVPDLTEDWLWQLAQQMARVSNQGISRAEPLLSATLPGGTRVQVVAPPATRSGFAMAFRRQVTANFSLEDLRRTAMFGRMRPEPAGGNDDDLVTLYRSGDPVDFLSAAVVRRKTILVSGGTSSGKTTFVNALLRKIPLQERLVSIEDSAELDLAHLNSVGLIATRGRMGESGATADELLQAALRLRPDRIVLGEVRGAEAMTFLRAVNTGHPGSMTTIHADSPARALDQLALLAMQSGMRIDNCDLREQIREQIDIVVQLDRYGGRRRVAQIRWRDHDPLLPADDGLPTSS